VLSAPLLTLLVAYQPPAEEPGTDPPDAEASDAGEEDAAPGDGDATDSPVQKPAGKDATASQPEGPDAPAPGEDVGTSPDEPAARATSEDKVAGAADQPTDELDMGDIFGDSEDLEDIEELPEADGEGEAAPDQRKRLPGDFETRFRIVTSAYFDIDDYAVDDEGVGGRWKDAYNDRGKISRQENRLEFYFSYQPNKHIAIVGDIEPVFMGVSQASSLPDLSSRRMLTPFHIESDAAYLAVYDALPNLDVRIGRQTLVWGTADKFNPTNNISPDDLEDRPLFTEPIGNQMIVADFSPLQDHLWFQAVYVPIFYPALLPPSASAALEDPDAVPPFARDEDIAKVQEAQRIMRGNSCFETRVDSHVENPAASIENGQVAAKIGSSFWEMDVSASYYYGRHDIPLPYDAAATPVANCMTDMPDDGIFFVSDALLRYPRMHVAGADFAASLPFLGHMGIWGEAGVFIPTQQHDLRIGLPIMIDVTPDDGEMNRVGEIEGPTVFNRPFVKATAGLDYTFGKHVYVNAQYVRGFITEFGAGNMGNYAVGGTDLIFFGRHLIIRLFGVAEFPDDRSDNYAAAIAPDIIVVPPWGYVTLELGGFALLGHRRTTLGQRGAGSSIVYFKVAGQF
jgi:hypothetical protein